MLKLTYTEQGLLLDHVDQSLDAWISNRMLLSVSTGIPIWIESTQVSFLFTADLPYLSHLIDNPSNDFNHTFELSICEPNQIEMKISGTWISSHPDNQEGVFICSFPDYLEDRISLLLEEYSRSLSIAEA
jgi:hypothetical protein